MGSPFALVAGAVLRRVLILLGWAFAVYVVWLGVPFAALYSVGQIEGLGSATRGEVARRVMELTAFLLLAGVPALLAWYLLLLSSGHRQAAALLATLVSLAYVATAPEQPSRPAPTGELADALRALRDASYGFLSLILSWLFAFALGAILLLAEPAAEEEAEPTGGAFA